MRDSAMIRKVINAGSCGPDDIGIRQIRCNDEREHGVARLVLQSSLAQSDARERMSEIIHFLRLAKNVPKSCHSESFACHSERSEESPYFFSLLVNSAQLSAGKSRGERLKANC